MDGRMSQLTVPNETLKQLVTSILSLRLEIKESCEDIKESWKGEVERKKNDW